MDGFIQWSPGVSLEALEKQAIQQAFKFFQQNKTATCNALGISIRTLDAKLEKYLEQDISESERIHNERNERDEFLKRCRGENTPDNIYKGNVKATKDDRAGESVHGAESGIRVEPITDVATESSLSVPEWEEIQELPSESVAKGSSKRSSKRA